MWSPPTSNSILVRGYTIGWGRGIPDEYTKVVDNKQRYFVIDNLSKYRTTTFSITNLKYKEKFKKHIKFEQCQFATCVTGQTQHLWVIVRDAPDNPALLYSVSGWIFGLFCFRYSAEYSVGKYVAWSFIIRDSIIVSNGKAKLQAISLEKKNSVREFKAVLWIQIHYWPNLDLDPDPGLCYQF